MTDDPAEPLTRYLPAKEAARLVGLSQRTLEKHRMYGTGPVYSKIGGRILYAPAELRAWVEQGTRRSTSDQRAAPPPAKRHAAVSPKYRPAEEG